VVIKKLVGKVSKHIFNYQIFAEIIFNHIWV